MPDETAVVVDLLYDFQCDECDFATDSQDYLKTHKRIKHENEGIIYRCDIRDSSIHGLSNPIKMNFTMKICCSIVSIVIIYPTLQGT